METSMYISSMSTLNPTAPEFFPIYYYYYYYYYHPISPHEQVSIPQALSFTNHPYERYYLPTSLVPSCNYQQPHNGNPPSVYHPAIATSSSSSSSSCKQNFPPVEVSEGHSKVAQEATRCHSARDSDLVSGSSFSGRRERKVRREGSEVTKKQRWVKLGDQSEESRRKGRRSFGSRKQKHPVVPVQPDGFETTVMIRNIPNRYTRGMLMEFLDNHCKAENQKVAKENVGTSMELESCGVSAFDFLYLPIDFEKQANKGYAFVNFTNPKAAWRFYVATHNQAWFHFQSRKIREIAAAKLQGKEELVKHFQHSLFVCESDDYLPVCFSPPRDGSKVMVRQITIGKCIGKAPNFE